MKKYFFRSVIILVLALISCSSETSMKEIPNELIRWEGELQLDTADDNRGVSINKSYLCSYGSLTDFEYTLPGSLKNFDTFAIEIKMHNHSTKDDFFLSFEIEMEKKRFPIVFRTKPSGQFEHHNVFIPIKSIGAPGSKGKFKIRVTRNRSANDIEGVSTVIAMNKNLKIDYVAAYFLNLDNLAEIKDRELNPQTNEELEQIVKKLSAQLESDDENLIDETIKKLIYIGDKSLPYIQKYANLENENVLINVSVIEKTLQENQEENEDDYVRFTPYKLFERGRMYVEDHQWARSVQSFINDEDNVKLSRVIVIADNDKDAINKAGRLGIPGELKLRPKIYLLPPLFQRNKNEKLYLMQIEQ